MRHAKAEHSTNGLRAPWRLSSSSALCRAACAIATNTCVSVHCVIKAAEVRADERERLAHAPHDAAEAKAATADADVGTELERVGRAVLAYE